MNFRKAKREDIPYIVKMIANDAIAKKREDYRDPLPEAYYAGFERIAADHNQELIVVEDDDHEIIGTMQLSFIPQITYRGGIRAQLEGVRIRHDRRGRGIGKKMIGWAIERSKERSAHLLQLTTDKKRPDSVAFYKKLGFTLSHEGLKMHFDH